jgi:hypothetical protein
LEDRPLIPFCAIERRIAMTCREYAKRNGFDVVGKLKRMPDHFDPFRGKLFRWYTDEASNEYHMDNSSGVWECYAIVTQENELI